MGFQGAKIQSFGVVAASILRTGPGTRDVLEGILNNCLRLVLSSKHHHKEIEGYWKHDDKHIKS